MDVLTVCFCTILLIAVRAMVIGIKNSIHILGKLTIFRALRARVAECPMVNAVTRMATFRQSAQRYRRQRAVTNNI